MKKQLNSFCLEFDARSANESFARLAVAGFAAALDPEVEVIADLKTAVSEAVTNAIVHGYKNRGGKIWIRGSVDENRVLTLSIKDKGCGIEDVEKAKTPLFTTDESGERSGMGFAIMESFSDSLKVRSDVGKGTKVVLKKKL